jgi:hypothetical protein
MAVIGIVSVWGGLYFGFEKISKGQEDIKTEQTITNEIISPAATRGQTYTPYMGQDTTKKDK